MIAIVSHYQDARGRGRLANCCQISSSSDSIGSFVARLMRIQGLALRMTPFSRNSPKSLSLSDSGVDRSVVNGLSCGPKKMAANTVSDLTIVTAAEPVWLVP